MSVRRFPLPCLFVVLSALAPSSRALAEDGTQPAAAAEPAPFSPEGDASSRVSRYDVNADPTGGAFTSPTLLFTPAAAVPTWTVRVTASLDTQGPTAADRFAIGAPNAASQQAVGFEPGIGAELGLPAGFTVGAGSQWVGGDTSPSPASAGISPYVQLRYHILGGPDGQGFGLGTSLTYKFVGFQGDPGEMELAFSGQYRVRRFEVGLQAVGGKDFATTDADAEVHAYAVYRVIPQLALGAATQMRRAIVSQPGETNYDIISGGIASLTLGRWQIGALAGESSVGLNESQFGGLGELFGSARF